VEGTTCPGTQQQPGSPPRSSKHGCAVDLGGVARPQVRWSGATLTLVEWHDRPRPRGATSTAAWRRDLDLIPTARPQPRPGSATSTQPGGLELYLVPTTMTSTMARRCDLNPARRCRPRRSARSRVPASHSLDGALHHRLAAYLDGGGAYGCGLAKGLTACESDMRRG
jgi:hypothetical protein